MRYRVSQHIDINSESGRILEWLSDFKLWRAWSPWSVLEPDHSGGISGEAGTVGHSMTWEGELIGSGRIVLSGLDRNELTCDLELGKPFKSAAAVSFRLDESDRTTRVTWSTASRLPWFLFFLRRMIASNVAMDYGRGLVMLKEIAERGRIDAETTDCGIVDCEGFAYTGLKSESTVQDIPLSMGRDFGRIRASLQDRATAVQHAVAVYERADMVRNRFVYVSAVSGSDLGELDLGRDAVHGTIPSGKMLEIRHRGSYRFIGNAWSMGMATIRARKWKQGGAPFELYHNSPDETAEEDLLTSVCFPLKG